MENPAESAGQPEPQPPEATVSHYEAHSDHANNENPEADTPAISTEEPPTTAQAVLRILTAVENISSKYDRDDDSSVVSDGAPSDRGSNSGAKSTIEDEPEPEPEPHIERLPMSQWNPFLLLNSLRYRTNRENIVATAFYTDVPETVKTAEDSVSDADFKAAYSKDKWSSGPQRILVHARGLTNDLREITRVPDSQKSGALAMVPPFKHLIHHRNGIKSKLDELNEAAPDRESSPTAAKDDSPASMRIRYLQCLYDFIQTELANYIGLELRIRDGDLEEVLFEEVYHLFKPGDLVLATEDGDDQIYQIYSVTGGRMLLSRRSESTGMVPPHMRRTDLRPGTWMDLSIVCFSMGWDGENIGPREAEFDIPYFSGRRLVTDLDLYPIQFHDDSAGLRKRLCDRGLKMVQSVGHKRYIGTSVPPNDSMHMFRRDAVRPMAPPGAPPYVGDGRADDEKIESNPFELVRGDVYIDYKALYVNFFSTYPPLSTVSRLSGETAEEIDTLSNDRLWNCSDRDMDSLQTEIFHNTHRHLTRFGKPRGAAEDENRLLLLPGQVPAFIFSTRKWEWLDIDNIEDIDKSEASRNSGWKELVIPHKFSNLLLSLVSNHISDVGGRQWETSARHDSTVQIDLVRGKGRGLIILLHDLRSWLFGSLRGLAHPEGDISAYEVSAGPPGSGKTSTAETIAAYTGRPLYAITCGDLGTAPKELEKNLVRHTRLGEKWGCVLLLDEADVFLTSRDYHDMHRNAMVSIFLRQLEYYSGILFLTTNIVGVIDEAFKSRIHVALEYPAIDEDSTLEIWSKMLQRIKRDNEKAAMKILFNEKTLMKFAKNHFRSHQRNGTTWNGRQIRNAFQTAIGIGQFERLKKIDEAEAQGIPPDKSSRYIRLTLASFETVAETTSDFEKYITRTRGDDRERAAAHEFRHDEHSREPPPRKSYGTYGSSYRTERDTGSSRAGRSKVSDRRYHGASSSPAPQRTSKGKEVHRRVKRGSAPVSDSDGQPGRDAMYRSNSGGDSDEEIIEEDIDDEEGGEDEAK